MLRRILVVAILAYLQLKSVHAVEEASKGRPIRYVCPKDKGLKYTTPEPNVVTYELKCDQGTTAKRIDNTSKDSQKDCANFCSEHPDCQSADYDWGTKNCARFSEYIPTIAMAGVNTWFPLEKRSPPKPEPQMRTPPACPQRAAVTVESVANASSFTADSECPQDDKKIFVSAGGKYMRTRCNVDSGAATPFLTAPRSSLSECLDFCSDTPGCKSALWEAGRPSWTCKLYWEGEELGLYRENSEANRHELRVNVDNVIEIHEMAFVIEPPTVEAADDLVILCSDECPYADGQTWDAPSGVKFHMDCCKRHGVNAFAQEPMTSLKACMAACATVTACQSVDWQQETGTCYFGKHSGEPTVSVAGWSSAHSIGCAGACKKERDCACSGDKRPSNEEL